MSDSVIVQRLLKIRNEEAPTRRKRVVKSDLPPLKAKQFVGKKRNVAKEQAQLASALKDKLLKAQYDVADKKLNARKKAAKAEFAEMNIADTPERRLAREEKEVIQLALKNAPSTQQMLLEYLRENDKKASSMSKEIVASRAKGIFERDRKKSARALKTTMDAETAALVDAFPPPQAQVGSPASTIPGERPKTKTQLNKEAAAAKKAAKEQAKKEEKAAEALRKGRVPEVITGAPTRTLSATPRKLPSTPTPKAGVPPAVAKAPGDASSDEAEGAGFNRALIGKGEQLHAGKQKVYMSETMAHLDTLNRHNQRTVIPRHDIVDVERYINTTLENRAIRGGPF